MSVKIRKSRIFKNKAKIVYNKKVAMGYHDVRYYKAMGENQKDFDFIEQEKKRLKTRKKKNVSQLLQDFKNLGESRIEKHWDTLKRIYKKNCDAASKGSLPPVHSDIMNLVCSKKTLLIAYQAIKKNKGALTRAAYISCEMESRLTVKQKRFLSKSAACPDGMSLKLLEEVSDLLKNGEYPWGASRRIYIPKPGTDKLRPLTIPPFMDRVVQTAIKFILEAIFEPWLERTNRSFGFRSDKGCHDAIYSLIRPYTKNMTVAIEGDIKGAYNNVNKDKLLGFISERIRDRKFINLLKVRLDYTFLDTSLDKYVKEEKGIPQGGIDAPYLWNIYMMKFDEWILDHMERITGNINKKVPEKKFSPTVQLLMNERDRIKRRLEKIRDSRLIVDLDEKYALIRRQRIIHHLRRQYESKDSNSKALKFHYCRYADDWIIIMNGPILLAERIKTEVKDWLSINLNAELAEDKTLITNMRKKPAHFLGFELFSNENKKIAPVRRSVRLKTGRYGFRTMLSKVAGMDVLAYPDRERLLNRFYMKHYCSKSGFSLAVPWLACLEPHIIIERYNAVIQGFANYYCGFIYNKNMVNRFIYILRYSCFKTLATKYQISMTKIIKKYYLPKPPHGKTIYVRSYIERGEERYYKDTILKTTSEAVVKAYNSNRFESVKAQFDKLEYVRKMKLPYYGEFSIVSYTKPRRIPSIKSDDFEKEMSWVNARTLSNFSFPCSICGDVGYTEMHHIKHVRKKQYSLINPTSTWEKMMNLRNRKQIPVCRNCHIAIIHGGKYDGPCLKDIARLYDNRTVGAENYIKPGSPYYGKTLIQKGWKLVGS